MKVQTKCTSKKSKMGRPCKMLKLGSSKDMNPRTRVLHRITLVWEHDKAYSFLGQVQITVTSQVFIIQKTQKYIDTDCNQWRTEGEGGFGVFKPPILLKFRRPSKIMPNSTRLSKLLKIAEFRMPTPQDVRKKGSKILKPPRFAIVLH